MSVFRVGKYWRYNFVIEGRRYSASTGKTSKQAAQKVERDERQRLENGYGEIVKLEERKAARRTVKEACEAFLVDYKAKHKAPVFAEYGLGHVARLLGSHLILEITPTIVKAYQTSRLGEKAAGKTINDEVALLLRLCGDQGDIIRVRLKRDKCLKLKVAPSPGKVFSATEQEAMLTAALASTLAARAACDRQARGEKPAKGQKHGGSPAIYPALVVALNCGMRDAEIKNLIWSQIDFEKRILTVGEAKTDAGSGRTIPLNATVISALADHARWYQQRFGTAQATWFVFPGGGRSPKDPTTPIKGLKTAWTAIRKAAGVVGRWHDNRHTLITELSESGAGEETIMQIAGHVSRQMLKRYSHIRTAAKRVALDDVERNRAADKDRRAAQKAAAAPADDRPPAAVPPRMQ